MTMKIKFLSSKAPFQSSLPARRQILLRSKTEKLELQIVYLIRLNGPILQDPMNIPTSKQNSRLSDY